MTAQLEPTIHLKDEIDAAILKGDLLICFRNSDTNCADCFAGVMIDTLIDVILTLPVEKRKKIIHTAVTSLVMNNLDCLNTLDREEFERYIKEMQDGDEPDEGDTKPQKPH